MVVAIPVVLVVEAVQEVAVVGVPVVKVVVDFEKIAVLTEEMVAVLILQTYGDLWDAVHHKRRKFVFAYTPQLCDFCHNKKNITSCHKRTCCGRYV